MRYVITVGDETFEIDVGRGGRVWVDRQPYDVDLQDIDGRPQYSLLVDHHSYEAHVEEIEGGDYRMIVSGRPYRARFQRPGQRCPRNGPDPSCSAATGEVRAPLPGLVVAVPVMVGQAVAPGDVVALLESMKMNLEIRSPWGGVVRSVYATAGADVAQGDVVVDLGLDHSPA
jgi:biotin carboxyl carrier protein